MTGGELTAVQLVCVWALPLLFAITIHEVAHGYVAYILGDKTAHIFGRLTLNPIKHVDIFGTILVPLVLLLLNTGIILGWAKPVPINSRNLRNVKRDMALIAVAGPFSNFIMALAWGLVAKIGLLLQASNIPGALAVYLMGMAGISINLMLMVLNILPIPQLDGGHILLGFLPRSLAIYYERLMPYGFVILLVLVMFGLITAILQPALNFFYGLIANLFGLPF